MLEEKMNYRTLDTNTLEQDSAVFYGRLKEGEGDVVHATVDDIAAYMKSLQRGPFLVAGVGSVLRFENPEQARDIDLAVVGLKYTSFPARHCAHSSRHLIDFTQSVQWYFKGLKDRLLEGREEYRLLGGSDRFSDGSGPFAYWDDGFGARKKNGGSVEVRTELESFGRYNSKGLKVQYKPGLRGIDIQFVFNEDPEEWRFEQGRLEESPLGRPGKTDQFFYAVLHEQE